MPAEADRGFAEERLVPAEERLVPAEADLVPAEADERGQEKAADRVRDRRRGTRDGCGGAAALTCERG